MKKKEIEKKIFNQYNKNLKFFKKNYPDLYEKLTIFSGALDNNEITPGYTLEYKDKEFNIYNIAGNNYIYQDGVKQYSEQVNKGLTFKNENGFNTLHEYAFNITKNIRVDADIEHIKKALIPFTDYINKNFPTEKKDKEFMFYKKVIVLGTWLGYHIDNIVKSYNPSNLLIIEPNLEIFRLSTFVYDYKKLSNKCKFLNLCIAQDNINSTYPMEKFLSNEYLHNYFIKFYVSNKNYDEYLQYFAGMLQFISPLNFDHKRMINVVKNTTSLLRNKCKFVNLLNFDNKLILDKPILIIGAGPSLKYNIEWLEKNQDKFILVSVAAALPRLDQHYIKPDIVTSLDAHAKIADQFSFKNKDLLDNCVCLFSSMTHSEAIDLVKSDNMYIFEVLSSIKLDFSIEALTATNVGEMTYALMLILGIKNIYLLGIDAAFDRKTGASHDEVVSIGGVVKLNNKPIHKLNKENSKIDMLDVVETKGNLRDQVKLTRLFYNSVIGLSKMAELYKNEDQMVYNLSDGAFFKYTNPLDPKNIDFSDWKKINKNTLKDELQCTFVRSSSYRLSLKEKYNLQKQIEFVDNILLAVKEYKDMNFKTLEEYEYLRWNIMSSLLESKLEKKSYLSKIFMTYFQLIDNYINYFFNDKNLKKPMKHMKKIQKIWAKELIKLLTEYKNALII